MKPEATLGCDVSREAHEALDRFASLLLKWNRTVNLVAHSDEPFLWPRHIEDSLQMVPLLVPRPKRAVDLGTGGGFPGLVLAIATAIPFDLVEADQRKAAFLREAARVTGAPVRVHARRIEECDVKPSPLITARGLAPLPVLLRYAAPLLAPGGTCLFLKGKTVETELTAAAADWHIQVERLPSRTSASATILRISEISRVHRAN